MWTRMCSYGALLSFSLPATVAIHDDCMQAHRQQPIATHSHQSAITWQPYPELGYGSLCYFLVIFIGPRG